MTQSETIVDELLRKALRAALDEGRVTPLFERLERSAGDPARPNWGFARLVAGGLTAEPRASALLRAMADEWRPFPRIVAGFALVTRIGARAEAADVAAFEAIVEDERRIVREGAVLALRELLLQRTGDLGGVLRLLASLEEGLLHTAVLVEALCERTVLDRLQQGAEVVRVLDAAVTRTDRAARSEERSQGLRELRLRLPPAIAATAARFREGLSWLEERLVAAKADAEAPRALQRFMRPETRALWEESLRLLGKKKLGTADLERLYALGASSAKPRRDAARVVAGTRRRGSRRR